MVVCILHFATLVLLMCYLAKIEYSLIFLHILCISILLFEMSIAYWIKYALYKYTVISIASYPKASGKSCGSAWAHRPWLYLLSSCRSFCLISGVRGFWKGGVEGGVMSELEWGLGVSGRVKSSLVELGDVGLKGAWDFWIEGGMLMARVLRMRVVCWAGDGCFLNAVLGDCLHGATEGTVLGLGAGSMTGYTRRSTMLLLPGFST